MFNLFENQVGYHSLALGFPSIDGCNAVCLQTRTGLFGIHVLGCSAFNHVGQAMEKRARAFAEFVAGHPLGTQGDFLHLYGVCFHGKRCWGDDTRKKTVDKNDWSRELKLYAAELGYTGPISGFDLSTVASWPPKPGTTTGSTDSAYVEYRRAFDSIGIMYKPWSQCVPGTEIKASSVTDGVNYRCTNGQGHTVDTFMPDKTVKQVTGGGSGFVLAPGSLRLKSSAP